MAEYNGAFSGHQRDRPRGHRREGGARRSGTEPAERSTTSSSATPSRPRATRSTAPATSASRRAFRRRSPRSPSTASAARASSRSSRAPQQIQLGEATTVLAGGMENMSQAPHVIRGARKGFKLGQGQLEDSLMVALLDTYCGLYMAQTSDNVAREVRDLARRAGRVRALRSQQCARRRRGKPAGSRGDRSRRGAGRTEEGLFERDDHMRPDTTLEGLAKLPPCVRQGRTSSPPATPRASSTARRPSS